MNSFIKPLLYLAGQNLLELFHVLDSHLCLPCWVGVPSLSRHILSDLAFGLELVMVLMLMLVHQQLHSLAATMPKELRI